MQQVSGASSGSVGQGVAAGMLAATIWGAWPIVSKLGVGHALTAWEITALRFGVAGSLLLPAAWRALASVGWGGALLLALGAGAPYTLLTVGGLVFAPAAHAGVIAPSCTMLFSVLGGWLVLGDRPPLPRLASVGLVVVGIALTGWSGLTRGAGRSVLLGDLMFVAGGLLWATYTIVAKARRASPVQAAALVSVISMLLYLPAFLLLHTPRASAVPLREWLIQAVFQGVFAAVLALVLHTRAVAILGIGRGALFPALVPAVTALLAWSVLGEMPGASQLAGAGIATLGMIGAVAARA